MYSESPLEDLLRNSILPKLETLKLSRPSSTGEINDYIDKSRRIIVVVSENDDFKYKNIEDLREISIYNITKTKYTKNKILISITKFKTLYFTGYFGSEVDLIVFRIFVSCDVFYVLRELYNRNMFDKIILYSRSKPGIIQVNPGVLSIVDEKKKVEFKFVILEVDVEETPEFRKYLIFKKIIASLNISGFQKCQFENILVLENISYLLAYNEMKKVFAIGDINFDKYLNVSTEERILLYNSNKYSKLLKLLKSLKEMRVFLVIKNNEIYKHSRQLDNVILLSAETDIYKYKDLEVIDTYAPVYTNNILIFYDILHKNLVSMNFRNIYIFKGMKNDFTDVIEIINSRKTVPEEKYIINLNVQEKRFEITETSALLIGALSFQMLANFLYLLKFKFAEIYLYIKNMSSRFEFGTSSNGIVCKLRLPPLHHSEIFKKLYISDICVSQKEAQNDVAFKVCLELYENGFMDKNLSPSAILFENNNIYSNYIKSIYGVISLAKISLLRKTFISNQSKAEAVTDELAAAMFKRRYQVTLDHCIENNNSDENIHYNPTIDVWAASDDEELSVESSPKEIKKQNEEIADTTTEDEEEPHRPIRKIPKCFSRYSDPSSVYVLNPGTEKDWDIGICCGESFKCNIVYKKTTIKYLKAVQFTLDELDMIFFFQVLFFYLHFDRNKYCVTGGTTYCYFVVPIKDENIDFVYLEKFRTQFLGSSVLDVIRKHVDTTQGCIKEDGLDILREYLMYNPINKMFYSFTDSNSDLTITDKIVPANPDKEFCKDEKATSFISYLEYFQKKYNTKITNSSGDKNLLVYGALYPGKKHPSILSAEILYTTGINHDLHLKYKKLKSIFHVFELATLSEELRVANALYISLSGLMICMTSATNTTKNDNVAATDENEEESSYERYEFLGDAIIKYLAVINLIFTDMNIDSVVKKKSRAVSNANLRRIAINWNIPEHCMLLLFPEQIFQPPGLFKLLDTMGDLASGDYMNGAYSRWNLVDVSTYYNNFYEYIKYFKAETKLNSTNMFEKQSTDLASHSKVGCKKYADIVEAIIGRCFCEHGMDFAEKLFYRLNVLRSHELPATKDIISAKILDCFEVATLGSHNDVYMSEIPGMDSDFITEDEVIEIERKLGYSFVNKKLIDAAFFHPSSNSGLGDIFEILEFVGDAVADIYITIDIFADKKLRTPFLLHEKRKSIVNNFSFGRMLYKMGLFMHARTCFTPLHMKKVESKLYLDGGTINKAFGDVFEAILGAVLVDLNFNLNRFYLFLDSIYENMKSCADETR